MLQLTEQFSEQLKALATTRDIKFLPSDIAYLRFVQIRRRNNYEYCI
jgi:hypothetical protein